MSTHGFLFVHTTGRYKTIRDAHIQSCTIRIGTDKTKINKHDCKDYLLTITVKLQSKTTEVAV